MSSSASKPVIGLLGAPGSGKSTIARQFASLGCAVIDADQLAREALDDPEVRAELVRWWGEGVLTPEGQVDRKAVAGIVFAEEGELRKLESLVHPRVNARRAALHERYQRDPAIRAIVEDCPLLLEMNLDGICDVLVFVDVPRKVRLERVKRARGWSEQELSRREKKQFPLDIKRRRADDVIHNADGEAQSLEQVRRVLSQILHKRT